MLAGALAAPFRSCDPICEYDFAHLHLGVLTWASLRIRERMNSKKGIGILRGLMDCLIAFGQLLLCGRR